jgi:hypothetical protein
MLHFDNYDVRFIVDQHALSWILIVRLIIRTIDITDSEPTRLYFHYLMQQIDKPSYDNGTCQCLTPIRSQ